MNVKPMTYREALDREIEKCIARREITRRLDHLTRVVGVDYTEAYEHIVSEIALNG